MTSIHEGQCNAAYGKCQLICYESCQKQKRPLVGGLSGLHRVLEETLQRARVGIEPTFPTCALCDRHRFTGNISGDALQAVFQISPLQTYA
jgi:hypothetical protein